MTSIKSLQHYKHFLFFIKKKERKREGAIALVYSIWSGVFFVIFPIQWIECVCKIVCFCKCYWRTWIRYVSGHVGARTWIMSHLNFWLIHRLVLAWIVHFHILNAENGRIVCHLFALIHLAKYKWTCLNFTCKTITKLKQIFKQKHQTMFSRWINRSHTQAIHNPELGFYSFCTFMRLKELENIFHV